MTVAVGLVLTFGAWAVIGFQGLAQYPQMLSDMTFLQQNRAVSIVGVLLIAGLPSNVATATASPSPRESCLPPGASPGVRTATGGRSGSPCSRR
jgi:hypothetical protein